MKTRKILGKWLVAVLSAITGMVLLGCPHNSLIVKETMGGENNLGRNGNNGVQLVITNFVTSTSQADRKASWLGSQRTIAPETIALTNQHEIDKYVFVVTGTQDGVITSYGPEFITIAPGTGETSLNISGGGVWFITVEGYDVAKLQLGTKDVVMTGNAQDVVGKKNDAMVLKGSATVDLGGRGNQVTMTLTNDEITQPGEVDIAVYFKTPTDVTKIFADDSKYKVEAELVNLVSQQTVEIQGNSTKKTLWDKISQPKIDTTLNNYAYRIYKAATGNYEDVNLQSVQGNTKLLEYKPTDNANTSIRVPKGKYMLRVKITDTANNTILYRSDPAFYVDGNRTTKGAIEIDNLLGTVPKKPEGFEVYWNKPSTTDQLIGYNAEFVWLESDIYAVGYTMEVADITDIYEYDQQTTKVTLNGNDEPFTNGEELWKILDDKTKIPDPQKYITTLDWQTTPQNHQNIPRWEAGSLLAGSTSLTLRLETGRVYTARIKAVNGSKSASEWTYIGTAGTTAPGGAGVQAPTKFTVPATKGIFDLMKFAYKLSGIDMYTLVDNRNVHMKVTPDDRKVTDEDLLQIEEYTPGTPIKLRYAFSGNTVEAKAGDHVLVVNGNPELDIVQSWQGWRDTLASGQNLMFGPVSGSKTGGRVWTKDDWTYSEFKDLELEPAGAGGSSIKIQAETSGTFDVLSLETIGFGSAKPTGANNQSILTGLTEYTVTSQVGVYRNAANSKLVVVMGRDKAQGTYIDFSLYVSIGDKDNDKVKSTFTDLNGNPIQIRNVVAKVQRSNTVYRTSAGFTTSTDPIPAYAIFDKTNNTGLMGMSAGEYTLLIEATTGRGYTVTQDLPMVILYQDQVAQTTIP